MAPLPRSAAAVRRLRRACACLAVLCVLFLPLPARAAPDLSLVCDEVATEAARQTGVPVSVLKAISLTETGRKRGDAFRPWPWTVNMEGKGLWFDSEDEARAYVYKEYKRGARSFDVGCFQINYKWHGEAFRSIDDMFDPLANALYAARFLKSLHAEQGDWGRAAGAYHSRTPEFANRYQARFEKLRNGLLNDDGREIPEIPDIVLAAAGDTGGTGGPDTRPDTDRVNLYPLLQTGGTAGLGSLVPLGTGGGMRLFGEAPAVEVN